MFGPEKTIKWRISSSTDLSDGDLVWGGKLEKNEPVSKPEGFGMDEIERSTGFCSMSATELKASAFSDPKNQLYLAFLQKTHAVII